VTIGVYTFEVHLPGSRSLKEKRQAIRRLKDRLRSRYNVAVAELPDYGDLWQRGRLAVVSVAQGRDALERLFESIYRESESGLPGHIIETGSDFIEAGDGRPLEQGEEWS
jgi:uncharacterized protein YlxP (DUF503 family)